ncbi:metal ABC transporter permease [Nitriliruptor alkaliphilus]|uniref:metal ABC transporter permease n=1 Tax=Nitriliruptor alkaliphilus TaxID=427918 RepID=UPI000698D890|nr:metal ABC transporter permease [Nitriliruptor alkaliphilus]
MELLTEPLTYGFFTRALLAAVLVGGACGAMSTFVVLRRMSYIGHGLAHSVLGGVAVGAALGYGIYPGAVVATLLSAVLIDRVARHRGLHADAAIGTVTTAMFAVGIVAVSVSRTPGINTEAILFGNVLGVTSTDLWLATGVAVTLAVTLFVLYKPLVFVTFDPQVARTSGVRAGAVEVLINVLTAGVVIASVRVLGVLLVAAAVVIPGSLARVLTRSFPVMLTLATAAGVASGVAGLYVSFHVDVPSGAAIVLVATALFAVALVGTGAATRRAVRHAREGSPHLAGTSPSS